MMSFSPITKTLQFAVFLCKLRLLQFFLKNLCRIDKFKQEYKNEMPSGSCSQISSSQKWPFDFPFSAPSQAPTNLGLTVNNSTSISVNWQLPPGISRNGLIAGFTVYYQKTGASGQANTVTVDGETVLLNETINGMEKYTEYDIQVSAFTYAGGGPKSSVVTERTSEDGKTCLVNVRMETLTCTMRLPDMHWAKNSQFSYFKYRIFSINRPGCLLNFWTLRVGAYSRWALTKFSPFLVSEACLFCNKTINGNNKTRRCNKARLL